jgi:hypothetical protein
VDAEGEQADHDGAGLEEDGARLFGDDDEEEDDEVVFREAGGGSTGRARQQRGKRA